MNKQNLKFSGMNNRARSENLPAGKARNAVNCLFTDNDEIILPRPGKTLLYSGDNISSLHSGAITVFAENSSLKKLNSDNTSTILKSGIDSSRIYFTTMGDVTYFANKSGTGKLINGVVSEWGVPVPPYQPRCVPVQFGGLFAGRYRVAIAWIGTTETSGVGMSTVVTVPEGGGIYLTNFPKPPSYVTGVDIYLSSVNSEDLYWYGFFNPAIDSLTLTHKINTIALLDQFKQPPHPSEKIIALLGKIYYMDGDRVYFTDTRRPGLQKPLDYWSFDGTPIRAIIAASPTLYVNTTKTLFKITNIDSPDGTPPIKEPVQGMNATKGSEASDPDGKTYYFMSDRGIMKLTSDNVTPMTYNDVAIPFFDEGTLSIIENNGLKYLYFFGKNGTQNPLANSQYNLNELARGSL